MGVSLVVAGDRTRVDEIGPYAWGVEVLPGGAREVIPPDVDVAYIPGSRVLEPGPDASAEEIDAAYAEAALAQEWLASGTIPGAGGEYEDMVIDALLDIHALTDGTGAALAGYNTNWRYVWPRDGSFIAAALATAGHPDDAAQILLFLQDAQHPDGTFEARYRPDGSGPPDDRGIQMDGTGWVLWAADHLLGTLEGDPARLSEIRASLGPLLERSTAQLLAQVATPDGLPPPSADYWEHRETELTLGTAAPILAGLHSAARIWHDHDPEMAERCSHAADALRLALEESFGANGYGRYIASPGRDAATAFLLAPLQPEPLSGAVTAWHASIAAMERPAGGLAPGESWREVSLSWTPQTTLYAMAAAHNGHPERAREWLTWVDRHRTPLGAIPEKVSPDGSPAAVAPLAWSAAMVVLAVAELDATGELPAAH